VKMAARFKDPQSIHGYVYHMYAYMPKQNITLEDISRLTPQFVERDIDWMAENKDLLHHFEEII